MAASLERDCMTRRGQSHPDAPGPTRSLVHPKHSVRIGNWNVWRLYSCGNVAQAAREIGKRDIDIMGISETHWTGQGKMQLRDGETMVYSGREDNIHREGVGILMSQKCDSLFNEWTPWNERMIQARFYSRHIKLTIIHIHAPTEDTDEQLKDEFYTPLQGVLDSRNQHDMLIITGDMNAKVGDQNWDFERVMGKH